MKYINTLIIIALIIVFCMTSYLWHSQKEISNLEMRSLATFNMVFNPSDVDSIVYKDTVIARLEEAMKDQFVFRNIIVKKLSSLKARLGNIYDLTINCLKTYNDVPQTYKEYDHPKLEKFPAQQYKLTKIGDFYRIENTDYICKKPKFKPYDSDSISFHVSQLQRIQDLYPQIKIYSYLVSSIDNTPWFDSYLGSKTPDRFEQIAQALPDNIKVKRLIYKDFQEYKELFFASDHHLNYKGSLKSYRDIYEMLSEDFVLSEYNKPIKEWNFTELFGVEYRGTRARRLKKEYSGWDKFITLEYDLGNRQTYALNPKTLKEIPAVLSLLENYKNGNISMDIDYDHYIHFYGDALLENGITVEDKEYIYIIRNNTKTGHNLLFVTDSTGRAIRDVLGTHFDTLVYLDCRIMSKIDIDYIINKYKIDIILLNGLGSVWTDDKCVFRFSDDFSNKGGN